MSPINPEKKIKIEKWENLTLTKKIHNINYNIIHHR